MDNLDFDAAWRAVADANGTPRHLIRDTAQVEQMRRIRAEQQAMLAEQQAQAQQAENLKNSAPMVRAVQPMMAGAA
jgi:hypothetical protein